MVGMDELDAITPNQVEDHPVIEALKLINPSPRIYAQMMVESYAAGGGVAPMGWTILTTSDDEGFSNDDYFGVAYVNLSTQQMIIAHRGTNATLFRLGDIRSDLVLALDFIPSQFNDGAEPFMTAARNRYREFFNGQDIAESAVMHTGHSLGAVLAEMSAYKLHGSAVTFDSPGSLPIIQDRFNASITPADVSVISFQTAPHVINRINEHVGHIYRIYPPHEAKSFAPLHVVQQHSSQGMLNQFSLITGLPFVVSDQGTGGWKGFSSASPLPFLEWDFDYSPHFVWSIHYANYSSEYKRTVINDIFMGHGGGLQNPSPSGSEIVGDNASNQLWGDTTGNDVLIPGGNADEVFSYGGDDNIQLGIDGAPDGASDTIKIVTESGTIGARQLRDPDSLDLLIWDDLPLQGLVEALSDGGYWLVAHAASGERVFSLRLSGDTLLIEPDNDARNSVTVYGFYEGALGIYFDPRSIESCSTEINTIIGKTDGVPIEGTCGPDEVKADEIEVGEDDQFNLDDNIKTYAGDDIIFADVNGPLSASRNVVDAGPGDDEVRGSVNYGSDTFYGGPGNDTLIGYQGNDSLYGGEGNDELVTSGVYSEPFEGYSQLFGGAGNDDLLAAANAYLDGGPGDDELRSGDQSILLGGDGNDFLGTSGRVTSDGGPGNDRLSYSRGSPNAQSILTGGPGDDTFYFYNYDNQGNRISVDGGPGKNEYHFQKIEDINNIRFNGGDTEGRLFYEAFDSFGQLVWTPFWNTHQYEAVYNDSTSELSVNVMSGASGAVVAGDSSLQSTVIFTVEHFYNGMLGITGVEGAPDLPTEVVTPTVPITNPIYLPLIQEQAQSQSQTDQAVTAMVGEPLPYEPIILATSGILPMVVYGGRVLTGTLPPKSVRTIHSVIHSLQTEIDVVCVRAERLRKRTRQWLQDTLDKGRNAA